MKTGTQPAGNFNLGKQGQKLSNTSGKPSAKPPTSNMAKGQGYGVGGGGKTSRNRSAGAAGGGMGIGKLGGGKMGKKRGR